MARARRGDGPKPDHFAKTYRWHFHAMRNAPPPETRPAEEIADWKGRDPIGRFETHMTGRGLLTPEAARALREQVDRALEDAIAFADASPFPDPKDLLVDMFAESTAMREITFQQALEEAVAEEMRRDRRVFTMGTDFTGNPAKEFGTERVRFTPISEAALTGMGLGAAGCGFRPDRELAHGHVLVRGHGPDREPRGEEPLPVRRPGERADRVFAPAMKYGNATAAQHSPTGPYPQLMNVPGLKIVVPSNPADALGLLKSAICDDDPVVYFEPLLLLGAPRAQPCPTATTSSRSARPRSARTGQRRHRRRRRRRRARRAEGRRPGPRRGGHRRGGDRPPDARAAGRR